MQGPFLGDSLQSGQMYANVCTDQSYLGSLVSQSDTGCV